MILFAKRAFGPLKSLLYLCFVCSAPSVVVVLRLLILRFYIVRLLNSTISFTRNSMAAILDGVATITAVVKRPVLSMLRSLPFDGPQYLRPLPIEEVLP